MHDFWNDPNYKTLDVTPEVWRCEYCGRFYSERTAKAHGYCQQEQDRKDAEGMWARV